MKAALAMVLLLCAAPALAEEASCTFTYNKYSRSIVKTCRGNLPVPGLGQEDRLALMSGRVNTCVITVVFDPATRKGEVVPAVCK